MATPEARPSFVEALRIIAETLTPLVPERVAPAKALGAALAAPVAAVHPVPRFDCSAMDGFALRSDDAAAARVDAPCELALGAAAIAGAAPSLVAPGQAVRITTGAPIPDGLDTVLIQERAEIVEDRLRLCSPIAPGLNIRRAGEDMAPGAMLLRAGVTVDPIGVAAAVAAGVETLLVRRRPRLIVFANGNELEAAGGAPGTAQIFDCNTPMIASMAAQLGLDCAQFGTSADDLDDIVDMLEQAVESGRELAISTGGVSGGMYDLVAQAVASHGGRIVFHGVQMRPGKPLLFAILRNGRPFFGLPGNPVAALIGFRFFVGAALRRLMNKPPEVGTPVKTQATGKKGSTVVLRALVDRGTGCIDAGFDQRSHVLSSLLETNAWLRLDQEVGGLGLLFSKWPSLD